MKKKLLIAMIPVLGMGALVGSGFSAWVFTDQISGDTSFTGSLTVTDAVSDMKIKFLSGTEGETELTGSETFEVTLDQFDSDRSTEKNEVTKGISVSGLNDFRFTLSADDVKGIDNYTLTVSYYFALSAHDYVTLSDSMSNLKLESQEIAASTSTNLESCTYDNAGTWTFKIDVPDSTDIIDYKTAMKPTTYDAYETMIGYIETKDSVTLTFYVSANLTANN